MQAAQAAIEASSSNHNHPEFTVDRSTRIYLDSVRECIDWRVKDAQSEIAQAIRLIRYVASDASQPQTLDFTENVTKVTLALAAALAHVLEFAEFSKEMKERLGLNDDYDLQKRDLSTDALSA